MNIDEKIAEYKADIEKCERVCAVTAIDSIRDAAMRKAEDCRQLATWLRELKQLREQMNIKADILDKIRKEIQRLRGCSCSCSDGIIDDVEDILDKYKAESEVEE